MPGLFSSFKGVLEITSEFALGRQRLRAPFVKGLRSIPYPVFGHAAAYLARAEQAVRRPLSSARERREVQRFFSALENDGRYGLTREVAERYWDYLKHVWTADMATLLLHLHESEFRRRALRVENGAALVEVLANGRGAVVAGLHLGPHAAIPLTLAQLGYDVAVIGAASILEKGERLSSACLPEAAARLAWLPIGERTSMARAKTALRRGNLIVAFVEQIASAGPRAADATLFGHRVRASVMLPHLASLASSAIVPASIVSEPGPTFTLRFESPLPSPERNEHAIRETTLALFKIAEDRALEHPEQWLLWSQLAAVSGVISEPRDAVPAQQPAYAPLS